MSKKKEVYRYKIVDIIKAVDNIPTAMQDPAACIDIDMYNGFALFEVLLSDELMEHYGLEFNKTIIINTEQGRNADELTV